MPDKYARDLLVENKSAGIRYKVIWNYRIIYEIKEEAVAILDIIHTSRNPEHLKKVR